MKRILFASVDIGYRIELYSSFIQKNLSADYKAESMVRFKVPDEHYRMNYTRVFDVRNHSRLHAYVYFVLFFIKALFRYDVFHFISGETLLTRRLRRLEFRIYKLLGKRIIMHFVGSDIRNPELLYSRSQWLSSNHEVALDVPLFNHSQSELILDTVRYADSILVSTPDLLQIIPQARYFPVMIDLDRFVRETGINLIRPVQKGRGPIRILHAPSNTRVKGSEFIYEVMREIGLEYGARVELMMPGEEFVGTDGYYCVSRYELFELLKKSDVLIDQLVIGWYGLQSIEGLLCDNVVLCHMEDNLLKYASDGCPILPVDKKTLKSRLVDIIEHPEKYFSFSHHSIVEWVRKTHTVDVNKSVLLEAWGHTGTDLSINR